MKSKEKVKVREIVKGYLKIEGEIKILQRKRKALEKINKKELLQLLTLIDQKIEKRKKEKEKILEREVTF